MIETTRLSFPVLFTGWLYDNRVGLLIFLVLALIALIILYIKFVIRTEDQDREDYRHFREKIDNERKKEMRNDK